jgi:hypothetical protein
MCEKAPGKRKKSGGWMVKMISGMMKKKGKIMASA